MKIAYIILVHKNPKQVARLITRLNVENTIFSIHVDFNGDDEPFKKEILASNPNNSNIQFLEKRYKPKWGGFNTIRAAVELVNSVLPFKPDSIVYISGQDYPIMDNNRIKEYLEFYKGKALIEYEPASLDLKVPNSTNRYYFCDYFNYNPKGLFNSKEVPLLARILTKLLPKRRFVKGVNPYIGRQWFILPLDIAEFVVTEFKRNKTLSNFYRFTIHSAEMYFQTLLLNSKYASRIVNLRTIFADYNAPNPIVWKAENIAILKEQNIPFARKFDTQVDSKVLDLIDSEILKK
ncbi:beta-1,6-N-acetylglucosaminyltransferase [Mucilaginibacter arboris]|uniref:Peptide O-xylosyltransferase n=1 Tax=Mucilaginibacter arboris TaxID=2682090 RepID=A0A7K1SY89_9SPHI|nr:beta-1,6-N-acetylglucosaminyltransferase [Mucilaginibacter arboris]MVN22228.1 hypothetical protein [Mucilaginibacter arboris]